MGILTLDTVPALNRHCLNALTVALSKMGLPILWVMLASVTWPLAGSTVTTQTPLPMTLCARASYGYGGRGAYTARALALDIGSCLTRATFPTCFGRRGGGVLSSTYSGLTWGGR